MRKARHLAWRSGRIKELHWMRHSVPYIAKDGSIFYGWAAIRSSSGASISPIRFRRVTCSTCACIRRATP